MVAMIMIKMIIIAIVIIIMGNNCFIIFIAYKGLHGKKCPIYNDAELTVKEIIDICVFEKDNENLLCRAVPQNVYYTTNFVINLSKVDVSDITVDGVMYHCQACPPSLINTNKKNGKICTKAETNSSEIFDAYKLKRQYRKSFSKTLKEHILKRTIVKFEADSGKLCTYAVIKYKSYSEIENMNSDSDTFQQAHGNYKKRKEPYMKTFPSVMKKINLLGQSQLQKKLLPKFRLWQAELLIYLQLRR